MFLKLPKYYKEKYMLLNKVDSFTEDQKKELISDFSNGMSLRDLGVKYNVSYSAVRQWLIKNGLYWDKKHKSNETFKKLIIESNLTGAEEDVEVAKKVCQGSKKIINNILEILKHKTSIKDTLMLTTALQNAWNVYARIRRLNDTTPQDKDIEIKWV